MRGALQLRNDDLYDLQLHAALADLSSAIRMESLEPKSTCTRCEYRDMHIRLSAKASQPDALAVVATSPRKLSLTDGRRDTCIGSGFRHCR